MGRTPKYNQERRDIIVEARKRGETYEKCAILAGVSKSLIMDWKLRYLDFQDQLKKAEEEFESNRRAILLESAKKGLAELLSGYEYDEVRTEFENDKNGNPIIKKQISTRKKVQPNVTAAIFVMTNLEPDIWKNRQTSDVNQTTKQEETLSLKGVPDELLAQVIEYLDNGENMR